MDTHSSEKLQKLRQMLEKEPRDTFLLYGLGMELKKLKDFRSAVEHFTRVTEIDPGYCYAYFQRGQTHELLGESEPARQSYRDGIAAAERVGDAHAKEELSAALEMLQ